VSQTRTLDSLDLVPVTAPAELVIRPKPAAVTVTQPAPRTLQPSQDWTWRQARPWIAGVAAGMATLGAFGVAVGASPVGRLVALVVLVVAVVVVGLTLLATLVGTDTAHCPGAFHK